MGWFIRMSTKLGDYCLEYIRLSAILNHLKVHGAGIDEMNVIVGELEALKVKMRMELDK